ncbi:MAG: class I SAM-dependent methyltransferase [Candidatus Korobacteraceae bacterium]
MSVLNQDRGSRLERLSSILANPTAYLAYQYIVGGIRARQRCIRDHVRPAESAVVLDIGCGPGYAVECFIRPRYFGFDISPQYIRHAKRKFGERVEFYCQYFDEQTLSWLPQVDIVLLMGVIHHMDDESVVQLLELAKRSMKPMGRLYTLDGCYQHEQSRIDRFFLETDRGKHVRGEAAYLKLVGKVFERVNGIIRKDLFFIPQTMLILECMDRP